jgi:MFS family permease
MDRWPGLISFAISIRRVCQASYRPSAFARTGFDLTGSSPSRTVGYAPTGQDGARSTAQYYGSSGKDERRLVKASFYTGVTSAILWYVVFLYWGAIGFSSKEIGYMEAAGTSTGVAAYLVGGYLADKLGRKRLFLVGLVATAIGLMIFVGERDYVPFLIAYMLTSIGGSLTWPCLTALMADKASPSDMKFFFSVQGFVSQVGATFATFFGIFMPALLRDSYGVDELTGYGYVFIVTIVASFVPIYYVSRVTETKRKSEPLIVHYDGKTRKMLAVYSLQNALIGVGAAFVIPWFPLIFKHGLEATDVQVAYIITFSGAVLALGWFIIPKFADLRGSVSLIAFLQIASVVPMMLIPYSSFSLLVVAMLYTGRNFLMLVPTPVLNAYLMNVVSEDIRASFLSISQVAWQLGFAPASAIAGVLWNDDYSKAEPFYIASALYVIASLIFWLYFRKITDPGASPRNL